MEQRGCLKQSKWERLRNTLKCLFLNPTSLTETTDDRGKDEMKEFNEMRKSSVGNCRCTKTTTTPPPKKNPPNFQIIKRCMFISKGKIQISAVLLFSHHSEASSGSLPCLVLLLLMPHEARRARDVRAVHHKACTEILSLGYRIINALKSSAENKGRTWSVNPKSFSYNLCATTHTAINLTSGCIRVHKTQSFQNAWYHLHLCFYDGLHPVIYPRV